VRATLILQTFPNADIRFNRAKGTQDESARIFSRLVLGTAVFVGMVLGFPSVVTAEDLPSQLKRNWIEIRTPNFVIYSTVREKKAVKLAAELESFRQVVFALTNITGDVSPIPTEIFLLRNKSEIRHWVHGPRGLAGLFFPGIRKNVILSTGFVGAGEEVLKHEYVHFVVGNFSRGRYPAWFSEGFAEFLGSAYFKGGSLYLGDVPKARISSLELLPWLAGEKLVDRSQVAALREKQLFNFYAQSWLLVHYLHNGREGRNFRSDMKRYLAALSAGTPDVEAFETSFEFEIDSLKRTLRSYGQQGIRGYKIQGDIFQLDYSPKTRPLNKGEAATILGRAMLGFGDLSVPHEVKGLVAYGIEHAPSSAQAWANNSKWLMRAGQYTKAASQLGKAIQIAPGNPYLWIDKADLLLAQARQEDVDPAQSKRWLSEAKRACLKAWKIDDSIPEVYGTYGVVLFEEGKRPKKAVEMLAEAVRLLPSNLDLRLMLAEAYSAAGERQEVLTTVEWLRMHAHRSPELDARIETLLASVSSAQGSPVARANEKGSQASDRWIGPAIPQR